MSDIPEIKHFSASSVNTYIENRAAWFRQRIIGDKFNGNHHTCRGTSVEAGINFWLSGDSEGTTEAIKHAIEVWEKETEFLEIEENTKLEFKQSIAPLINCGVVSVQEKYLDRYNKNPKQQVAIKIDIPGCARPCIGYIDWLIEDKLIIDNKVSGKSPSKLSQGYLVQASVYNKALGLPVEFHYEIANKTPKAMVLIPTKEELEYGWRLFCRAARAIETLLDNPMDYDLMEALFLPNPDAYYNDEERNKALKDFGFLE